MTNLTLNDIDCSRFIRSPKQHDFVSNMKNLSPVFEISETGVSLTKMLTYLVLMYDPNTPLRHIEKDYWKRKNTAAIIADFTIKNNAFTEACEQVITGRKEAFNRAVIEYVRLSHNTEYHSLVVYERMLHDIQIMLMSPKHSLDKDLFNLSKQVSGEVSRLETYLFGEERKAVLEDGILKALTIDVKQQMLALSPEEVEARYKETGLDDFSPYGDYTPDKLTVDGFPSS